jgi:hypothetical protein
LNAIVRVEGRTGIVLENPEFSRACGRISQATLLICRLGAQSRAALMILSGSILPEVMSNLKPFTNPRNSSNLGSWRIGRILLTLSKYEEFHAFVAEFRL